MTVTFDEIQDGMRIKFRRGKQREFLILFQRSLDLTQRQAAKYLKTKRRTYRNWLNESCTLPAYIFKKVCEEYPQLSYFKGEIEALLPPNWGRRKGGIKRSSQPEFASMLENLKRYRDLRRRERKKQFRVRLTKPLKEFYSEKKRNLIYYLAVSILTDGSLEVENKRISFFSKDKVLRDLILFFFNKLSKYPPSVIVGKDGIYRIRLVDKKLSEELLSLSPSYKTSPSKNQSVKEYLREKQPSLRFLLESKSEELIKKCVRIALSTDGSLSKSGMLLLSCSHPTLCKEWKLLFESLDMKMNIRKSSSIWSGYVGVGSSKIGDLKKFKEIGGFINGVKSFKSKYFKGWEKNMILTYLLEWAGARRAGSSLATGKAQPG